jgi:hypothetical protein
LAVSSKSPGTSGSRRGDDLVPRLHGRCPEDSVRSCRGEMTLDVESVVGRGPGIIESPPCGSLDCSEEFRERNFAFSKYVAGGADRGREYDYV